MNIKVRNFIVAGETTANGNIYPKTVVQKAMAQAQERVRQRRLLVHTGDPPTLRNAVGIVTQLDESGGQVSATVELLPVLEAKDIAQEIRSGRLCLAPRGTGSVVDGVIQDDFQLESWGIVPVERRK